MKTPTVLIVDDHPIILQGCQRILEDMGIKTVITARDIASGYRLFRRHSPSVTIVDLSFQGSNLAGLTLIKRINRYDSKAPIIVLSMHSDLTIVSRALQAGAKGYVIKDASMRELAKAIKQVLIGEEYLGGNLAKKIAFAEVGSQRGPLAELTARELQTLSLLAEGKTYGSIAADLDVSYKTIVNTCWQLRQKLEAKTLPELVRTAVQLLAVN
ncbi:MAG TPA: response regulator transcription factor [Pseudolabrys sp.]|jgi:two-component system invasion response regulator UvrY|nr:response regulator transcription factor [Pseudolabrys sp.]